MFGNSRRLFQGNELGGWGKIRIGQNDASEYQ